MLENLIAPKDKPWRPEFTQTSGPQGCPTSRTTPRSPGEQRQKPSAVPMASFAYSWGVKKMEVERGTEGNREAALVGNGDPNSAGSL